MWWQFMQRESLRTAASSRNTQSHARTFPQRRPHVPVTTQPASKQARVCAQHGVGRIPNQHAASKARTVRGQIAVHARQNYPCSWQQSHYAIGSSGRAVEKRSPETRELSNFDFQRQKVAASIERYGHYLRFKPSVIGPRGQRLEYPPHCRLKAFESAFFLIPSPISPMPALHPRTDAAEIYFWTLSTIDHFSRNRHPIIKLIRSFPMSDAPAVL